MTTDGDLGTIRRIAEAVRETRKAAGLSAAQVSDRTSALGKPLSRAVISDLETGRKKTLDVSELIVLAAALETSPVNLVFPGAYGAEIDPIPGVKLSQYEWAQWFSGLSYWVIVRSQAGSKDDSRNKVTYATAWRRHTATLRKVRDLEAARRARSELIREGEGANREQIRFYDSLIGNLLDELDGETDG